MTTTIENLELYLEKLLATEPEPENEEGELPDLEQHLDDFSFEPEEVSGIIHSIRSREAQIEFLKSEIKRLQSRAKAMEQRMEQFKDYLSRIMQRDGLTKVQNAKGTLYLRRSDSVKVNNESELPSELVKTEINFVPQKKDIKEHLKEGVEVPGAELESRKILCIK